MSEQEKNNTIYIVLMGEDHEGYQIREIYYNRNDAIEHAKGILKDTLRKNEYIYSEDDEDIEWKRKCTYIRVEKHVVD